MKIFLNANNFWVWVGTAVNGSADGIGDYLKKFELNQKDSGYILDLAKDDLSNRKSSEIMKNLSLFVPKHYFNEIQYCALAYTAIFSKVFPPLAARVEQLAYIEWLLYTEPNYISYRDHLVHMFKVGFVGDRLLNEEEIISRIANSQFNKDNHFSKWCASRGLDVNRCSSDDKKDIVRMAFFLAALFHDFGYGYFFLRQYKDRMHKLYDWLLPGSDPTDISVTYTKALMQSLPGSFIKSHHSWLTAHGQADVKINNNVIAGFLRDCLPLNHSIASTFFMLDLSEKLWKSRVLNENLYMAFHLAAEAAMIHDMTNNNNWLHLRYDNEKLDKKLKHFLSSRSHESVPIAILLILADELSIWDRYQIRTIQEENLDQIIYELSKKDVPEEIQLDVRSNEISITVRDGKGKKTLIKKFNSDLAFLKKTNKSSWPSFFDYTVKVY